MADLFNIFYFAESNKEINNNEEEKVSEALYIWFLYRQEIGIPLI